jgi:hypothetical protein
MTRAGNAAHGCWRASPAKAGYGLLGLPTDRPVPSRK